MKIPLIIKIEQEIIKSQKELGSYYLSCATREQSRKIDRIEALKRHLNVAKDTFQEAKKDFIKFLENYLEMLNVPSYAVKFSDFDKKHKIIEKLQELKK